MHGGRRRACMRVHVCVNVYVVSFLLSLKSAVPFDMCSPFDPFYWVLAVSNTIFPWGTPVFPFILCGCWNWMFLCPFPRSGGIYIHLTLTPSLTKAHLSLSLCTSFFFLSSSFFHVIFVLAASQIFSLTLFPNSIFAREEAARHDSLTLS